MRQCTVAVRRTLLLLTLAAALSGCETDRAEVALPRPQPVASAPPEEPVTVQQASANCWMKFERGRADLSLDARSKLVDQCIDDRMKGQRAPR